MENTNNNEEKMIDSKETENNTMEEKMIDNKETENNTMEEKETAEKSIKKEEFNEENKKNIEENTNKSETATKIEKLLNITDKCYIIYEYKNRETVFIDAVSQIDRFNYFISYSQIIKSIEDEKKFSYISVEKLDYFQQYGKLISNDDLSALIKNIYSNLKSSKPSQLHKSIMSGKTELTINLDSFNKIVDMILIGLSFFINSWSFSKKITSLFNREQKWKDLCNDNNMLNEFFEDIAHTQTLNIQLLNGDKINDNSINLDRVLLFVLFYKILFPNTKKVKYNMNISNLNKMYLFEKINKELRNMDISIFKKYFNNYSKCFMSNYLLAQKIWETYTTKKELALQIYQYDDYLIEAANLFSSQIKEFNINPQELNIIYYSNLFKIGAIDDFTVYINSLDSIVFQNIMNVIYCNITENGGLAKIYIDLFPKDVDKNINLRKILLNKYFYELENSFQVNLENYENKIDFFKDNNNDFNWFNIDLNNSKQKIQQNNKIIPDELILDLLCDDFSKNLLYLIMLFDKNSTCESLNIKLNIPMKIINKQNYLYALGYFIYDYFLVFEKKRFNSKMKFLKISTNIIVPSHLTDVFNNIKVNLMSANIENLSVKVPNISKILNLNYLPFNNLECLKLSSINYDDLKELCNGLSNNIDKCTISQIKLKLIYTSFIDFDTIYFLFSKCISKSIKDIIFNVSNELNFEEFNRLFFNVINGIANCPTTDKEVNVDLLVKIDIEEKNYYKYQEMINNLDNAFSYDKLNGNMIIYYSVLSRKKVKLGYMDDSYGKFNLVIGKTFRNNDIDNYIFKINKLNNEIIMPEKLMQISGFILNYIYQPVSTINLNITFTKS